MAGFANDIVYANNGDFSVAGSTKGSLANGLITNGQFWIGSTATNVGGTHINVGTITSTSLTIGYSSPNITINTSGGGAPIETIAGDTGSISGSNVTIYANNATNASGGTVLFTNSGTVSTLTVSDISANLYIGQNSGNNLQNSSNNVGVGVGALGSIFGTGGDATTNTAVGYGALTVLTTGSNNTVIGNCANALLTGNRNIIIGSSDGDNLLTNESNNIIIANSGVTGDNNAIRIGRVSGPNQHVTNFQAGITGVTVASSAPTAIDSNGQLSSLGFGTSGQVLTSNGAATSPTWQSKGTTCIFSAYLSSNANNVTGDGTVYTIIFNTALVNTGSAYNTGTGIFTAPTTGNYLFTSTVTLDQLAITHTEGIFSLIGSVYENRFARYNMGAMSTAGAFSASGSFIIPMTAGDTMHVFAYVNGGAKTVDVIGAAAPATYTNFSGYLIL